MARFYVATAIPPADARLDLGFVLEIVQADVLARHRRLRGDRVRFLTGTGDNGDAEAFAELREPLALSYNDFIYTGRDARHRSGADRLRQECAGDLDGTVFRLSRHAERLHDLIRTGRLRIEPSVCRDEVLGMIDAGLHDVSVSPVWWDALSSHITSLGYGVDGSNYRRWWVDNNRRVHVVDRSSLRQHAIWWPAMLLSAGVPLPTDILVHDRLTTRHTVDPNDLAMRYGPDAVRWWLLRDVPRVGSADFSVARLVARANEDLAKGLGYLVDRVVVMVHRYRDGRPPTETEPTPGAGQLVAVCRDAPELIHDALSAFDFRRATAAVWRIVEEANRYIDLARPWELARTESTGQPEAGEHLDAVLTVLLAACRDLAYQLTPFLPTLATRIARQCISLSGPLAPAQILFPRLRSDRPAALLSDSPQPEHEYW